MWDCICKKKLCSWWSSSSSSTRLLLFMSPLFVVAGLVALLGPKTSNWVFTTTHYSPWIWRSSLPLLSPFATTNTTVSSTKEKETHPDLQPRTFGEKEESLNNVPLMNETDHSNPITGRLTKKFSKLQMVEASLEIARAAIREAKNGDQTQDPEYIPNGPMYWNATAFHRSYSEMEKQFKVFVYEEGEPPVFHIGPCAHIYAIEGVFIQHMEISQFRTRDPDKAHVYLLPISVTMISQVVYVEGSNEWDAMKNTAADYVNLIAGKYPYWNRSRGADHVMVSCHDWAPEISLVVPYLHKNSIRALCNANTSESFMLSKDVSIPEIFLPNGTTEGMLGGPPPSQRSFLVFFAGGVHGPVRPVLLEYWENKDKDMQIHKYLPEGVSYFDMVRKSKYCICPSGYEVASPRIVEAIFMGCVPVIIKDHYVMPFSDVLNWKTFSVILSVEDVPNLKNILMAISQPQYIKLQRSGIQVRRHFVINSPPKRYDAFHMVLHSIWLRRLNIRLREH